MSPHPSAPVSPTIAPAAVEFSSSAPPSLGVLDTAASLLSKKEIESGVEHPVGIARRPRSKELDSRNPTVMITGPTSDKSRLPLVTPISIPSTTSSGEPSPHPADDKLNAEIAKKQEVSLSILMVIYMIIIYGISSSRLT